MLKIMVKSLALCGILFGLIACQPPKNYQDNTQLESPPALAIATSINEPPVTETVSATGLNTAVILEGKHHLTLKQPFEKAWTTLAEALAFNNIIISDRNRETGEYFIDYDPDNTTPKNTGLLDKIAFFLFTDDYEKARYKLTVTKNSHGVKIVAEKLDAIEMDLLDDGEDIKFDDKIGDGAEKLTRYLYNTLKNDLPLN
jgi:hypothetical protein